MFESIVFGNVTNRRIKLLPIYTEVFGENLKKPFASAVVEIQVRMTESCSAGSRRHFAASAFQTFSHLRPQGLGILFRQIVAEEGRI